MHTSVSPFLRVCAFVLCLAACAPPTPTSNRPSVVSSNLAEARMPVLRSDYFEKKWGKPNAEVMADGTYRLRYRQDKTLNFVFIQSRAKMEDVPESPPDWEEAYAGPEGTTPAPPAHQQSWRHATILGTPVKWYQEDGGSGADFPAYRTTDFALTAPDGRTGFYRITVCSNSEAKAADWIQRVGW